MYLAHLATRAPQAISVDVSGSVRVWDVRAGRCVQCIEPPERLAGLHRLHTFVAGPQLVAAGRHTGGRLGCSHGGWLHTRVAPPRRLTATIDRTPSTGGFREWLCYAPRNISDLDLGGLPVSAVCAAPRRALIILAQAFLPGFLPPSHWLDVYSGCCKLIWTILKPKYVCAAQEASICCFDARTGASLGSIAGFSVIGGYGCVVVVW